MLFCYRVVVLYPLLMQRQYCGHSNNANEDCSILFEMFMLAFIADQEMLLMIDKQLVLGN